MSALPMVIRIGTPGPSGAPGTSGVAGSWDMVPSAISIMLDASLEQIQEADPSVTDRLSLSDGDLRGEFTILGASKKYAAFPSSIADTINISSGTITVAVDFDLPLLQFEMAGTYTPDISQFSLTNPLSGQQILIAFRVSQYATGPNPHEIVLDTPGFNENSVVDVTSYLPGTVQCIFVFNATSGTFTFSVGGIEQTLANNSFSPAEYLPFMIGIDSPSFTSGLPNQGSPSNSGKSVAIQYSATGIALPEPHTGGTFYEIVTNGGIYQGQDFAVGDLAFLHLDNETVTRYPQGTLTSAQIMALIAVETDRAEAAEFQLQENIDTGDAATLASANNYTDSVADGLQPLNANLTAESGLTGAPDRISYYTGVGAKALATFTGFGRTLVALADYAALKVGLAYTASDVEALATTPNQGTTTAQQLNAQTNLYGSVITYAALRALNAATVSSTQVYAVSGCGVGISYWQTDGVLMQPIWGDVSFVVVDANNEGQSLSSNAEYTLTNSGTAAGMATTPDSAIPAGANWPMSSAFQTGTQAAGQSGFNTTISYDTSLADQDFKFLFNIPVLSNPTDSFTIYFGSGTFTAAGIAVPPNCVRLKYTHSLNSGNWTTEVIKASGTPSSVNTGVAAIAATSILGRMVIRSGVARFWINGTLIGTVNSGIPSGNTERMSFGVAIASSASINPKYLSFDCIRNRLFLITPRTL